MQDHKPKKSVFTKILHAFADPWGAMAKENWGSVRRNANNAVAKDTKPLNRLTSVVNMSLASIAAVASSVLATLTRPDKRWKEVKNFARRVTGKSHKESHNHLSTNPKSTKNLAFDRNWSQSEILKTKPKKKNWVKRLAGRKKPSQSLNRSNSI